MSDYRLVQEHDGKPEDIGLIGRSLTEYNEAAVGYGDQRRVAIYLRDTEDEIVAGLYGSTYWDWLEISLLWVREDLRGQGYGSQLLRAAEQEGSPEVAKTLEGELESDDEQEQDHRWPPTVGHHAGDVKMHRRIDRPAWLGEHTAMRALTYSLLVAAGVCVALPASARAA